MSESLGEQIAAALSSASDDDSSSSSSGGGAPAAPKVDVYISDTYKQDAVKRQKMSMFATIYQQLWGEPATEEYLMKAVNAGLNSWEFTAEERTKPAFATTDVYRDQARDLATLLANLGVA